MYPYYTHQPSVKGLDIAVPSLETLLKLFFEGDQEKVIDYIDGHRVSARIPQVKAETLRPKAGNWFARSGNVSPYQLVEGFIQATASGNVSIFDKARQFTTEYFHVLDKAVAREPEPFGPIPLNSRDYYSFNPKIIGFELPFMSLFEIALELQQRWSGEKSPDIQVVSDYIAGHFQSMTDAPSSDPFTLVQNFPGDFTSGASFRELVFQVLMDKFGEAKADQLADLYGQALRDEFDSEPHVVLVRRDGQEDKAYITSGYRAAADLAAMHAGATIIPASKH